MSDESRADVLGANAQAQIRSIIERAERLEAEKAEVAAQIKEVFAEAKANGFCPKVLRKIVRMRKVDRAKRMEEEAITELYLGALGELPIFEGRSEGAERSPAPEAGIATVTLTMADGSSASGTPDQLAVAERMLRGIGEDDALYQQAVAIVRRDGTASTSYIQRRLQLGYNLAASLIERMEQQGLVGPLDHAGKREVRLQTEAA